MTKQTTLDEEDVAESWPDPVGRNVCRYKADEARSEWGRGPPRNLRYRLKGDVERREWRKLDYWMDLLDGWTYWLDLLAGPTGWTSRMDPWTHWMDLQTGPTGLTDCVEVVGEGEDVLFEENLEGSGKPL